MAKPIDMRNERERLKAQQERAVFPCLHVDERERLSDLLRRNPDALAFSFSRDDVERLIAALTTPHLIK